MKSKLLPLAAMIAAVCLLSACASERVKEQARKEKANKDQYVDYYPVGSNIPIKVPKDDPRVKSTQADTERTQEVFRDVQRSGTSLEPNTGGR
jgi:hypothetical protein